MESKSINISILWYSLRKNKQFMCFYLGNYNLEMYKIQNEFHIETCHMTYYMCNLIVSYVALSII